MSAEKAKFHLAGLFRTRVIVSLIGMAAMCLRPEIAIPIASVVGFACGVSFADAMKEKKNGV